MAIATALMFMPALSAIAVGGIGERDQKLGALLGFGPTRSVATTTKYCFIALAAALAIHLTALCVGALVGVYSFDLRTFSGFREALQAQLVGHEDQLAKLPPIKVLVALQLVGVCVGSLLNAVPALGEEIGWRGWLLPKLMPLGLTPAVLITGVIWALWHAPLLLLGYNYPAAPRWLGLICMTGMCVPLGAILAWVRLQSGSVLPGAIGHGAFNAGAGLFLIFSAAGHPVDPTKATALGWTGWIFPAALASALFWLFPVKPSAESTDGQTAQL